MNVLIISAMPAIREKLSQLMEAQPHVETVQEAEDTLRGLQAIEDHAFDVAVIDLQMPLRVCTGTIRRMLGSKPGLKIIALSMYSDRRYLMQCLQAGACGYILKDCAYEDLADAVRTVTSGRHYVSSALRGQIKSGDPTKSLPEHHPGEPRAKPPGLPVL
jgi:DNA-binding NarL/FixJ family response regulator